MEGRRNNPFRLFKTHLGANTTDVYDYTNTRTSLSVLPFREDVRYIVPVRNGLDTAKLGHAMHNSYNSNTTRIWGGYPPFEPSFTNYLKVRVVVRSRCPECSLNVP